MIVGSVNYFNNCIPVVQYIISEMHYEGIQEKGRHSRIISTRRWLDIKSYNTNLSRVSGLGVNL